MEKQDLIKAISRSGGKQNGLDESDALWGKIDFLQQTHRYYQLVRNLASANDRSNFLALVLETNFAFQFESKGFELEYEIQQTLQHRTSIDFLRKAPNDDHIYFELRLLQQAQPIRDLIKKQLEKFGIFHVFMDGQDEQNQIVRIQNTVLGKVQDKNGNPTKFFSTDSVNIVAIDATASLLNTIDIHDCMLAIHGDPSVEEVYRRKVFGLFQEDKPEYPQRIHDLAAKYTHIRNTLHGVLFLFKVPNTGSLAYDLEHYLILNSTLISTNKATVVLEEVARAIPVR